MLEVEIGELKSLQGNQIHIDEYREGRKLDKGETIVDDTLMDSSKYKLVMIGRKLREDEDDHLLSEAQE